MRRVLSALLFSSFFRRGWRIALAAGLAAVALGGAAAAFWYAEREAGLTRTAAAQLTADVALEIPPGTSLRNIGKLFAAEAAAATTREDFVALARRKGVGASLQAGFYRFPAGLTVGEAIEQMAAGKVARERITFVEGRTFAEIRAQLAAHEGARAVLGGLSEAAVRLSLNIEEAALEGLFLPDTYFFRRGDSDLSVLRRAHERLQTVLNTHWQARAHDDLASPYHALILASIVEKETGQADERGTIASVFLNRLRKGIRLQADPTVIYGLGARFDGNLTRAHLREDTAYNTYTRAGLPPTPIALAGEAAIAAVLNPPTTDYYYFVATGDGRHYFSKTLREHNNAVNRYQR